MPRNPIAAVVLGLMMVASAACTQDPSPATPVEASPQVDPVTPEPDAERTIYLWHPSTGDTEALFSAPTHHFVGLADAERSHQGSTVVFERDVGDGPPQIFVFAGDGPMRPLTDLAGGAYDPTLSPDGETIAFSGRPSTGSDFDIYAVDLSGGAPRRIAGTSMDDDHPDWSPDGTQIVFGSGASDLRSIGQGEIWVASVETHELRRLTPRDGRWVAAAPAWSPDGRWIAYRVFDRGYTVNGRPVAAWLWRMRPDGSHRQAIGDGGNYKLMHEPSWSPDGRSIVIERSDWRRRVLKVLLLDPRTGKARSILELAEDRADPSWGTDGILLSLWSDDPVPSEPAPRRFQVEAPSHL